MNEIINFKINDTESIILETDILLKEVIFCDEVYTIFKGECNYKLTFDCLRCNLRSWEELLTNVLRGDFKIHASIDKNIGYLWNVALNGKVPLTEEDGCWVGEKHYLWGRGAGGGVKENLKMWLYNDTDGKIILEITPIYRWHFGEPDPGNKFITYDEFMKNYQPVLKRVLSHESAQEWLIKTQNMLKKINLDNEE